ncbi:MAG: Levanase [Lachnoclostridium sp.]|jgi:fructan beta-fructosidase
MDKIIKIRDEYLYIPIQAEKEEKILEIYCLSEDGSKGKVMELSVPVGEEINGNYAYDYMARFPVKQFTDKTFILKGDFPEAFYKEVTNSSYRAYEPLRRPSIHFTPERGWLNDPNGLVYQDGLYHMYYQYNPCNTKWNNMSWGHAVSRDLLSWEHRDLVMIPDEDGMIFSGSGMRNDRQMLGLPKEALLFFYTAAGGTTRWSKNKLFVQKLAYSIDGGNTLIKTDQGRLETISGENRDPKVFWHEESKAYIMCLWIKDNQFAILRSSDLLKWEISDRLIFDGAWECPDLIPLRAEDGSLHYIFWTADGYYYWGNFDGFHFRTDGVRHLAYINKIPYAAQTFSGVKDRVISVPWLRISRCNRLFTGAMGIPRELSVKFDKGRPLLVQKPVRELESKRRLVYNSVMDKSEEPIFTYQRRDNLAVWLEVTVLKDTHLCQWNICGSKISYNRDTGMLTVNQEEYFIGKQILDFTFLIDDVILEISANRDIIQGVFEISESIQKISFHRKGFEEIRLYEIVMEN